MKRASFMAAVALWLAVIIPPAARAAGGPVSPIQDNYIGVPGVPYRYVAWNDGRDTIVKVRQAGAGTAVSALRLAGHWGIPAVDFQGATTGLSADGRTLILAEVQNNLPVRTTRLLVLGTQPVAVRARITLSGWSNVDAISPDGRWLYLIHYRSSNVNDYEVRAYDLIAHRLLTKPVVDPRDRDEVMAGYAISRVMSAGGRWAYTLYLRPSGVPFLHALDTSRRRAVCVDLPSVGGADVANAHLRLGPGGTTLQVNVGPAIGASINTRTFKVSPGGRPSAAAQARPIAGRARPAAHTSRHPQSDPPWEFVVLLLGVLAVVAGAVQVVRSRRRSPYRGRPESPTITVIDPRLADRVPGDDEVPVA